MFISIWVSRLEIADSRTASVGLLYRSDDISVVGLLLLFAMIRSVVKSFKVPDVEVAAARMSNESALTRMTDSTSKKPWSDLTLVLDG